MGIHAVIMCGGGGSRLWPASRLASPKQFLPLVGDVSLLGATVARVGSLAGLSSLVLVAGVQHADQLGGHVSGLGVPVTMLLEPEPRDSAPAMAAAAHWIRSQDPDGIAIFLASDHHIPDEAAFRQALLAAVDAARAGNIVTLGIAPREPSTQYGYIKPGQLIDGSSARQVERFVEKPGLETARAYVSDGYLWNSGNFVCAVSTLIDEFEAHVEGLNASVSAALDGAAVEQGRVLLGPAFRTARKISVDFAVMEKTTRAAVLPADLSWSDLGSWDAVWAQSRKDEFGNAGSDSHVVIDAQGCLLRADNGTTIAAIGVKDLAIVVHGRSVLVSNLSHAHHVKTAAQHVGDIELQRAGAPADGALRVTAATLRNWLFHQALPLWSTLGTDHSGWGFHEALDQDARALPVPRRARVQARQIYSFATAGRLGWQGPWSAHVERGLKDFQRHYLRPDGLFRTLVSPLGAPLDDTPVLYDQAFALLAFASAHPMVDGMEANALALLHRVRQRYAYENSGFRENAAQPFQSNPHMHLLEACLAWMECGTSDEWRKVAGEVVSLALDKFIDAGSGMLREYFSPDWTPAQGHPGRIVEPGHLFEWAWLLLRWHRLAGAPQAQIAAEKLVRVGETGVAPHLNVAVNTLLDDGTVLSGSARLWPQTERIKAHVALAFSATGDRRREHEHKASMAAQGLSSYFVTAIPGLWFDKMKADGGLLPEASPASSLYHIICAIEQLNAYVARQSN